MIKVKESDKQKVLSRIATLNSWCKLVGTTSDLKEMGLSAFELIKAIDALIEDKLVEVRYIDNTKMFKRLG